MYGISNKDSGIPQSNHIVVPMTTNDRALFFPDGTLHVYTVGLCCEGTLRN